MIEVEKEPTELTKAFWALNDKYPDYVHCVRYDGVNPAFHDLDQCKKSFQKKINDAVDAKISNINKNIEMAQENGQDLTNLLAERKRIRAYSSLDTSQCQTIDDLINLYPKDL